jgi:hypothetical protein
MHLRWNEFLLCAVAVCGNGENSMPKENDLEGPQDQGGKHGGQKGMPRPEPWPAQQSEIPGRSRPGQPSGTSPGAETAPGHAGDGR